jgi:hypothetical protein
VRISIKLSNFIMARLRHHVVSPLDFGPFLRCGRGSLCISHFALFGEFRGVCMLTPHKPREIPPDFSTYAATGPGKPSQKGQTPVARLRSLASYGVPVVGTRIEIAATRATSPHKKQRRRCRYPDHYVSTQSSVVAPGEGNHRGIAPASLAVLPSYFLARISDFNPIDIWRIP